MTLKSIEAQERTERQRNLIEDAAEMAGDTQEDSQLIGYIVMGFYSDGATRASGYRPNTEDHKIGAHLWEAWARETLNQHIAYGESARATVDVLNGEI